VLRKDNFKIAAHLCIGTGLRTPVSPIIDTGAGPSVIAEALMPPGWRDVAWRAPTRTRIIDASGQAVSAQAQIPLTLLINNTPMRFTFLVVKTLSVPLILGCDFQRRYTKAILPQDGQIVWTSGSTSQILGHHGGTTKAPVQKRPKKARSRPNELILAGLTVIPPSAQVRVPVTTRSTGTCLVFGRPEFLSQHGLCLAHGHHQDIRRQPTFDVLLANARATPVTLAKGTRVGVAEPYKAKAFALTNQALLTVKQDLAVRENKARDILMAGAQSPEECGFAAPPPADPPVTDPEVNWERVPKRSRGRVRALLADFRSLWTGQLGELKATTHRIQLKPGAKPVFSASYRAGPHRREEIENQVKKMLEMGVIEPSNAEWAFPVVVVPKPHGQFRFCVDYRRLNEMTVRDVYPIPRMNDCLDSLGDASVFSTIDCNAGYWQMPLAEEDRDKTTFTSHAGLYRFLRLPFRLTNAPASFQWALDIILSGLRWKPCLVYLDDVIVFSRSTDEHIRHLREFLLLLWTAGVTLKPSMCHFFQDEVEYLGQVVRPGQLLVHEKNTRGLAGAQQPRTQSELKSFLGMCNVYRRFVKDYSHLARPLTKLTSTKLPSELPSELPEFDAEQKQAFEALKNRLTSAPILTLPRLDGLFILDTDACAVQLGCTLVQKQPDGTTLPIGYYSRVLLPA